MENLSFEQTEIFALQLVMQNMIAIMNDDQKTLLKENTLAMADKLISMNKNTNDYFKEVKESAMSIIEVGTSRP
ncbi:TPA: hypothetical protein ACW96C_004561 [Yersinia enterocolitica]|uniref:hypothetical protein n=1 Tax=Yersinia enterocolitica TaxID=630 RepID=UPI0022FE96B6|nr:hypothetical protein [Yersinia enterocolitica]EKN6054113.1 hypothetical protein [Yersinia enterocolitica]ELI8334447.1 hypothetical protein [Yersinia enterocolitica]ELZ0587309.1 hypothetical protein [Yersinia enterocolitica]MDA5531699.1 hypothetical protein [Yersinia enterocolitica]HDL7024820.1 hypothetical protein [Yersinia enterocolitica]